MKKPLPTSIPFIIPAAVLAEAKKKKLVYVGTGDGVTDMFRPSIEGYYWEEGDSSLRGPEEIIGHFKTFHFFLPRKTAAEFFDLPKAPKTRYFKGRTPTYWYRDVALHKIYPDGRNAEVFKDGTERDYGSRIQDSRNLNNALTSGDWVELTAAEAEAYLLSFKKPASTPLDLLTAENTLLKARVAKLEAAIRDAAKAL